MNLDSYKVLKLANGEMIVCEINAINENEYDIMNPLKMEIVPRMGSKGGMGETLNLAPWLQHFSDQRYFNIDKNHCILIANASIGLSKYYEYVMKRIDASWQDGQNLVPENNLNSEEEPEADDVYNDLLKDIKPDSKLIH